MVAALLLLVVVAAQAAAEADEIVLRGRVLGPNGEPWPGVTVTAVRVAGIVTDRTVRLVSGLAGADASYTLKGLTPGQYVLCVEERGAGDEAASRTVPMDLARGIIETASSKGRATPFLVPGTGTEFTCDIQALDPVRITGRLLCRDRPVPDATVGLMLVNGDDPTSHTLETDREPVNEDGAFQVSAPTRGRYIVVVRTASVESLIGTIDVSERTDRVALVLGAHSRRIKLIDHRGRPVHRARMIGSHCTRENVRVMRDCNGGEDGDGVYDLPFLSEGRYEVRAMVDAVETRTVLIEVGSAETEVVELRFPPVGRIEVQVRGCELRRSGVAVRIERKDGYAAFTVTSDERGRCDLRVAAGSWVVGAQSPTGEVAEPQEVVVEEGQAAQVVVRVADER